MSCEEACKDACDACEAATCPAVAAMHDTFDAIRRREVERHAGGFDADADQLDRLTRRLMQRVVAVPRSRLPEGGAGCPGTLLEMLFTPPEGT